MRSTTSANFFRRDRAFTLIELIAVIVVLAVLAGAALPRFFDWREEAEVAAARKARGNLSAAVQMWAMNEATTTGTAAWPNRLNGILETDQGNELLNPYWDPSQPVYHRHNGAVTKYHPGWKTIERAVTANIGAIWYNPNNGAVRFRVPQQATNAQTLALYNEVNLCDVPTLGYTGP